MATKYLISNQNQPTWCPGCGNFGIFTALQQAINQLDVPKEQIVIVTDVGCSGNTADFLSTYVFHGLHGRALPVAAGIKLANHTLTVIVILGDGGLLGEGTTHLMNLMRGNHDLLVILHNNYRYSLTTGQYAPTTPKGTITPSTPEGVIEMPINPTKLALACEPTFVARSYALNTVHLTKMMVEGIKHHGFSFLDVLQPCITFNRDQTLDWYKKMVRPFDGPLDMIKAQALVNDHKNLPIGIFYQEKRLAYHEEVSTLGHRPLVRHSIEKIDITKFIKLYQ
jgi:2-oxoglutarate ferredoxin oxidoreductase subunit beta